MFKPRFIGFVDEGGNPIMVVEYEADKVPLLLLLKDQQGRVLDFQLIQGHKGVLRLRPLRDSLRNGKFVLQACTEDGQCVESEMTFSIIVDIKEVNLDVYSSIDGLFIRGIRLLLRNNSPVPIYLTKNDISVSLDDKELNVILKDGVKSIGPYSEGEIEVLFGLEGTFMSIDELSNSHEVLIRVLNAKSRLEIPALSPLVELKRVSYSETGVKSLEGIVVEVENNWQFPINTTWLKVFVNGVEMPSPRVEVKSIPPGSRHSIALNLLAYEDSEVEVVLGKSRVRLRV